MLGIIYFLVPGFIFYALIAKDLSSSSLSNWRLILSSLIASIIFIMLGSLFSPPIIVSLLKHEALTGFASILTSHVAQVPNVTYVNSIMISVLLGVTGLPLEKWTLS